MLTDYSHLTEGGGSRITREQLQRMYTRYAFAAKLCEGKDVLEAACGVGQGLGLLGGKARSVVAGDFTQGLVDVAKAHYRDRFDIRCFDAQAMPFADRSFDVVLLYEAIYYLPSPQQFLSECRRVLRPGGSVVICTANKDWSGFSASPSSYEYFGVAGLRKLLDENGFSCDVLGDCRVSDGSLKGMGTSIIRRVVVKLGLMPKSLKAREKFKKIFFGKLLEMPPELSYGMADDVRPVPIPPDVVNRDFKVLFAVGRLREKAPIA